MITRDPGAPGMRQVSILAVMLVVFCATAFVMGGCGRKGAEKEAVKEGAAAATDTSAFLDARAVTDTTARLAAWEAFLKKYPTSSFRPRAVASLCGLLLAKDPAKLEGYLAKAFEAEKDPATRGQLHYAACQHAQAHAGDRLPAVLKAMRDDPTIEADACNMVAWDLVERSPALSDAAERNRLLDEAIALAAIGVPKATDDDSKASILDTQAWAHFGKGEYAPAIDLLVQSVRLDSTNTEVQMHLAQAYDKAGRSKEALALYADLLIPAEDPMIRERVEALSKAAGEPPAAVFKRIDQAREANARPAPAFTLKDYSGKELAFADTKGKVVLLNFWHPT